MRCPCFALSLITTTLLLHWNLSAIADISVSAANPDGESEEAYEVASSPAGSPILVKPAAPTELKATRLDGSRVMLQWTGTPVHALDYFHVFRAKDNQNWAKLYWTVVGTFKDNYTRNTSIIDDTAFVRESSVDTVDHTYRYVVVMKGFRFSPSLGVETELLSDCSNEAAARDVFGRMRAGIFRTSPPPFDSSVSGTVAIQRFVPSDAPSSVPPILPIDPYNFTGPFATHEDNGTYPYMLFGEKTGYLPRGISLSVGADILSTGMDLPFLEFSGFAPYLDLGPYPITPSGVGLRLTFDGHLPILDASASGNTVHGFDAASNPKWLMVRAESSQAFTVNMLPNTGIGMYPVSAPPGTTIQPTTVPAGQTAMSITTTQPVAPGSMIFVADTAVAAVTRKRKKTVKVMFRQVAAKRWWPKHNLWVSNKFQIPALTNELKATIRAEMDAAFHRQANVQITVEFNPTIVELVDDDLIFCLGTPEARWFEVDAAKNFLNGYDYTIFYVVSWAKKDDLGKVAPGFGGTVNRISGEFAFINLRGPYMEAHELGHLFGLRHPWDRNTGLGQDTVPDRIAERLMGYDTTNHRLIKAEWDKVNP